MLQFLGEQKPPYPSIFQTIQMCNNKLLMFPLFSEQAEKQGNHKAVGKTPKEKKYEKVW